MRWRMGLVHRIVRGARDPVTNSLVATVAVACVRRLHQFLESLAFLGRTQTRAFCRSQARADLVEMRGAHAHRRWECIPVAAKEVEPGVAVAAFY